MSKHAESEAIIRVNRLIIMIFNPEGFYRNFDHYSRKSFIKLTHSQILFTGKNGWKKFIHYLINKLFYFAFKNLQLRAFFAWNMKMKQRKKMVNFDVCMWIQKDDFLQLNVSNWFCRLNKSKQMIAHETSANQAAI